MFYVLTQRKVTLSCVVSSLALLSADSVTSAMANAQFATRTSALRRWSGYAMSVALETIRTNVLFAVERQVSTVVVLCKLR
jgi:hypothetical protein